MMAKNEMEKPTLLNNKDIILKVQNAITNKSATMEYNVDAGWIFIKINNNDSVQLEHPVLVG